MVCDRCIMSVELLLKSIHLFPQEVGLGYVDFDRKLTFNETLVLKIGLHQLGFELLEDKEESLTEQVKNVVIHVIYKESELLEKFTFSAIIQDKTGRDYKTLSEIFSKVTGNTLEHYIITQKVERVKELLTYEELNISEISRELHYSSVAHMSNQFKKIEGMSPSEFRKDSSRKPLDKL